MKKLILLITTKGKNKKEISQEVMKNYHKWVKKNIFRNKTS
jgi:hypothetical protein